MNIKEVEWKTGLTRANIRYYEKEGLLSPERKENGYRDYSDKDADTLLKIRLLRELGISIEELRRLIRGQEDLQTVLEVRIRQISAGIQESEARRRVCFSMQADNAQFATLHAQRYLDALYRPLDTPHCRTTADVLPKESHPWRRFFARWLDRCIVTSVLFILINLIFHVFLENVPSFLILLLSLFGMLVSEPFFLHFFATTPGKWLMGISVYREDGGKLTIVEGFQRMWGVLWHGYGLEIPIYGIFREIRSYLSETRGETLPWDEENEVVYRDEKLSLKYVGFLAAVVLTLALDFFVVSLSHLPPNRGTLTQETFTENYAWYMDQMKMTPTWQLTEEGVYEKESSNGNTVVIEMFESLPPEIHFTTGEDGVLKSLALTLSASSEGTEERELLTLHSNHHAVAAAAAVGAYLPPMKALSVFDAAAWAEDWEATTTYTADGVELHREKTMENCEGSVDGSLFLSLPGEDASVEAVLTINFPS